MKSTSYLILILSFVLFGCTYPDDPDELISSTYVTEFTVNGKTYNIGTTRWSAVINAITTDEGQKGNLEMNFPQNLKLGTYKFTDGYILIGYENLPTYNAVYNKVNVTITKIGSATSYGSANIEGSFSGTFVYYDLDSNGFATAEHEVQLSGKFSTTP